MNRREFLKAATAGALFSAVFRVRGESSAAGEMQYRILGHTGERVSIVGLGGGHIGLLSVPEGEAKRLIRAAIDHGINFMDNCWDYNGGESEIRMGKALLNGYRQRVFLMIKLDGRDARTATVQLEQSLKRLGVDYLDLIQFHEVIRMNDADRSLRRMELWKLCSKHVRPEKFAISVSPGIRVQKFTSTCSTSPASTTLPSTRYKCR